jgi:hypothetical protein
MSGSAECAAPLSRVFKFRGELLMTVLSHRVAETAGMVIAALWMTLGIGFAPPAFAQDVKQIKLADAQVTNFISAQTDLASMASKIQAAGEKPDPALQAELEGIAKKHGFTDFAELDDVAANISIVMAGLDAQTGTFTDPVEALQKELEDVKKDESIPEADKKQLTEELSEAIKTTPPLQNKENVEIVKAHRAEIEKALQ